MLRFLSFLCICLLVLTASISDATAKSKKRKTSQPNNKYASIVMDADTGMILSQRYADKSLHPASLTKMMTLLLTFEALDNGYVRKTDRVRISNHAASMSPSKLGLPAGSSIKLEDAIYALVTKSANDIAVALAEHLAGSERKFAQQMTARAHTIGMNKTTFKNASGLHDKNQVSSARDMAKMARYILQRYPHYYRYFSTKNFTYRGVSYHNHNRLMDTYKGMDGFKTGYVNASGFNLVASARRDGRRLIGVVFGGRTSKSRNDHMAEILDSGFKKASTIRIAHNTPPPLPTPKPVYSISSSAPVGTSRASAPASFTSLAALESKTQIIANASNNNFNPNYAALNETIQNGKFGEMAGEGDVDPAVSKRLETGLIAIAVHKGEYQPNPNPASAVEQSLKDVGHAMVSKIGEDRGQNNSANPAPLLPHPKDVVGKWSVQIGAFNTRVATDEALRNAQKKLPPALSKASMMSVPLRTEDGIIFRARLGGLSQQEAQAACTYFKECMPIAPVSTQVSAQ
ncbi:MAG: D-alanyl-D-alanine carboxypeptidase family protein [Alphaproteobacteria bacterium]|nr:D-alanyl-D-alanine carboxypeptidase family protein [Alphaproteobacteria bacterium]